MEIEARDLASGRRFEECMREDAQEARTRDGEEDEELRGLERWIGQICGDWCEEQEMLSRTNKEEEE